MRTAVGAPAPRPSDEELLEAIAGLTLRELGRLRIRLAMLLAFRRGRL